jgi:hypothetical protein
VFRHIAKKKGGVAKHFLSRNISFTILLRLNN